MELPASYANLMQFVPPQARPMVEAAQKMRAEQAAAFGQQLAQQQSMLDQQRALKQAEIDKAASEIPDEVKQYPAFQHDVRRQKILADMDYARQSARLGVYGQPVNVAEQRLKQVDQDLERYKDIAKPFEETQQYKDADKNWTELKDVGKRINLVTSAVNKAEELLATDEQAALRHMRTNLIKPLNSILSNDAIQLSEMLIRYNDLLNAPETSQLANKSIFNPTTWFNKYNDAPEARKGELLEELTSKVFNANPRRFLETAINGVNGYMDGYNTMLKQQVIDTTSPGVARRMGAVLMEPIKQKVDQNQPPAVFPQQSIPFQGQPVQGGSEQMPAQQAAPVQQAPFGAPPPGAVRIKQR
jgi:hypothetical protein